MGEHIETKICRKICPKTMSENKITNFEEKKSERSHENNKK